MATPDPKAEALAVLKTLRAQLATGSRNVAMGALELMGPMERANMVQNMLGTFRAALDQFEALMTKATADMATKEQVIADLRLELELLKPDAGT